MGAIPFALLVVLRYAEHMTEENFRAVLEGLHEAGEEYQTPIVGGDTGGAKDTVLSATALGFCGKNEFLLRRAEADQLLCLTGTIGRAFAARAYFEKAKPNGFRLSTELEDELLAAWKRPKARVKECYVIRKHATACQDVSDGLKATIEQLLGFHSLGAEIIEDNLPIDESTRRVADFFKISHAQLALSASPDFELLFAIPERKLRALQHQFGDNQFRLSVIGKTNNTKECVLISHNGIRYAPLPGVVWRSQWGSLIDEVVSNSPSPQAGT